MKPNLVAVDGKVSRAVDCDEKVGEGHDKVHVLAQGLLKIAF